MVAIGSVMCFTMNQILVGFTSTAVAVFGAYFKLQSFIFMPIFGLNNAMVSIVAYNYGARKPDRIRKTVVLSCVVAFLFMLCGFAVFQLMPETLLSMFAPTAEFLAIGCNALQTISWAFLVAGFCVILSSVFRALGTGLYATIIVPWRDSCWCCCLRRISCPSRAGWRWCGGPSPLRRLPA